MNLIDENNKGAKGSKKIFAVGGTAVVLLVIIIIVLLAYSAILNQNKLSLTVNSNKYNASNYMLERDDVVYISIEDLVKMLGGSHEYKGGNRTSEVDNQCYVTNGSETAYFEVGADSFYKVLEADNQRAYYDLEKPVIKENGKFYIPINATKTAFNVAFSKNKNSYVITSIGTIEAAYNKEESKTFIPDTSIVWDTSYRNKILLKDSLVIVKGQRDELGLAKVSYNTDKKKKMTTVSTQSVITPKYESISYVEKYNYLIVEADGKKGVVKLNEENGNFSVSTIINPQYDDIVPITDKLFLVTKIEIIEGNKKEEIKRYGIIKSTDREEDDIILPMEYEQIGVSMSDFPDNDLVNAYILYDSLIPVKKNNLWGFTNLKGSTIIDLQYDGLGFAGNSNANSNVLIIPEEEAIVIKKGDYYGIISKTNRTLVKNLISKIYKDNVKGETTYFMVFKGEKLNVLKYFDDVVNKKKDSTDSSTTNTNTTEKTDSKSKDESTSENSESDSTDKEKSSEEDKTSSKDVDGYEDIT